MRIATELVAAYAVDTPFKQESDRVRALHLTKKILVCLNPRLPKEQHSKIIEALRFSSQIHAGVYRKDKVKPYFLHLLEVTVIILEARVYDFKTLCAAILHDTIEDTEERKAKGAVGKEIRSRFGNMVYALVLLLSKYELEAKDRVWKRMLEEPDLNIRWRALVIKYADRIHNIRTLGAVSEEGRQKKLAETRKWFGLIKECLQKTLNTLWHRRTLKNHSRLHLPELLNNQLEAALQAFD
jgi:(p)ppGpp synthase/HD superfamily hydrolase